MVSVVIRQTLVQLETPNEMRGRVSAVDSVFIGAAWVGPVASIVLGGIGTCLVAVACWRLFPDLARRDRLLADTPSAPRR